MELNPPTTDHRRDTGRGRMILTGLVLLGAIAAGCTGGESTTAPDGPPDGDPGTPTTAPPAIPVVDRSPWRMHHIDGRFRGANALGAADVDGDGRRDYVTNYEFDQRWILALHPGDGAAVRSSWPTVEIWRPDQLVEGSGKNPESTALGDFDGDGNVDAAGAHGFSDLPQFEGSAPGVHVVWGPEAAAVRDPSAWTDAGWIPVTVDLGHPHWISAHDVNADGLTDIVYGGRRHGGAGGYDMEDLEGGNGSLTGISWLEAPADPAARRDLAAWRLHRIDATTPSGHGFVFADLDGDGDDDLVDANADFDTPQDQEAVYFYEHPGGDGPEVRGEWRRTLLPTTSDFHAKPSVAVGDLDRDGDPDIVTQTARHLVVFRNSGERPLRFETVEIPKPPQIAQLSRPVRLADIDRDGDLDVVGMLVHEDGDLPADKAAAYVLLNEGRPFEADGWQLLPVKWGSGVTMLIPGFGEKWDQVDVTDVDGDGDLDIVANCEEWWAEPRGEVAPFYTPGLSTTSVAVVWFENRIGEEPADAEEAAGRVAVQAEEPTEALDSTWVERAPVRGDDSGTVAVQALNGLAPEAGTLPPDGTAGSRHGVQVAGGDYILWARVWSPSAWSSSLGGDASDSVWISIDGGPPALLGDAPGGPDDQWTWVRSPEPVTLGPGRHDLTLRVRERGVAVDRIELLADPAAVPED